MEGFSKRRGSDDEAYSTIANDNATNRTVHRQIHQVRKVPGQH